MKKKTLILFTFFLFIDIVPIYAAIYCIILHTIFLNHALAIKKPVMWSISSILYDL